MFKQLGNKYWYKSLLFHPHPIYHWRNVNRKYEQMKEYIWKLWFYNGDVKEIGINDYNCLLWFKHTCRILRISLNARLHWESIITPSPRKRSSLVTSGGGLFKLFHLGTSEPPIQQHLVVATETEAFMVYKQAACILLECWFGMSAPKLVPYLINIGL